MKKIGFYFCAASLFLMVSCSGADKEKEQLDSIRIAELTANYQEATSFNDSLMLLMGEIYNGLDSINVQEGLLYNMGGGDNHNRREEIRHNLSAIKQRLYAKQSMLDQMERKLKASGNENSVLVKTIEQMKDRLTQQENRITELVDQLNLANDSIVALNETVSQQQEQIEIQTEAKNAAFNAYEEAENQLNTVYYALGTNKELKQNGLLEKKFLGATKVLKGDFNDSYFTKADKRTLTSIPTGAKKIKIWTNMPEGSYEEIKNADNTITLNITNPKEFWSLSPYLVLQVD